MRTSEQFKSKNMRIIMGLIGLVLAFAIVTRALDTGSWWQYSGALLLLVFSFRLFRRAHKSS